MSEQEMAIDNPAEGPETASFDDDGRVRDTQSGDWVTARMTEAKLSVGAMIRLMEKYGDDRPKANAVRSVQRMRNGSARVSAEMRLLLGLLIDHPEIPR